jgi:hypothetical protein
MAGTRDPGDPGSNPDPQLPDDPEPDEQLDDFDIPEDGEGDDESEEEPEELAPEPDHEPRRQTRRERQQENWRERALRAEVERDVYARQQQQPRGPAPADPQQQAAALNAEYERISMLPPVEQMQAIHQLVRRENAITQLNVFDSQDRRDFQRLQDQLPSAKRLAGRVEEVLQQQRAAGVYSFSREQIFDYLIGNELRTRGRVQNERERRQGAERVRRQTTRPSGGRGDVPSRGRRGRTQEQIDDELLRTPIRDTM